VRSATLYPNTIHIKPRNIFIVSMVKTRCKVLQF
jgi:hypothetical protein